MKCDPCLLCSVLVFGSARQRTGLPQYRNDSTSQVVSCCCWRFNRFLKTDGGKSTSRSPLPEPYNGGTRFPSKPILKAKAKTFAGNGLFKKFVLPLQPRLLMVWGRCSMPAPANAATSRWTRSPTSGPNDQGNPMFRVRSTKNGARSW